MIEVLKKEAENGDATAEKEYGDWHTIEIMAPSLPKPTEKADLMKLKW
ncbi:hypothetical protein [Fusobacterium necrophorum]|nr:hypothetical protein [Fusobacterium necrophorum]